MHVRATDKPKKTYLPRFGVSCSEDDLKIMDLRAESLGLDRSTYLVQLARQDFVKSQSAQPDFMIVPKEKLVLPP